MPAVRPSAFTTSSHSLDLSASPRAPRANGHEWRADVIDGVTLSVAIAVVPSFALALIWRAARGEWVFVILLLVITAGILVTRSRRLGMGARAALLVGLFLMANGVTMMFARSIPFNGSSVPMGAAIATLVGGVRWGAWTLAVLSTTWLIPWILVVAGAPSPVDIRVPSQYLRLLVLNTCLSAGLVAAIRVVVRSLEHSLETGDELLQRVRQEARATQALAGRLTEAEENERAKLSRELHDDLGQRLTALRMKLQLGQLGSGLTRSALDECVTISEDLLQDVRTFARGLRPPLLDEVGLVPALRAMLDLHTDAQVHSVRVDAPDHVARLPHSVEMAAYRVLQEALANVLRHAAATRVSLEIVDEGLALTVALSDNGRGFDSAAVARKSAGGEHLGLVGMRERAEFIGADLEIQSAPGKGTTVRLRIPRTTSATILSRAPEPAMTPL